MTELEKALKQLQLFLEEAEYEEAEYLMTLSEAELDQLFRRFKREVRKRERAYSPNSDEYKSLSEQRALVERIEKMLRDREKENSGLMLSGPKDEKREESSAHPVQEVQSENRKRKEVYEECVRIHDNYVAAQKDRNGPGYRRERKEIYREVAQRAQTDPVYMNLLAILEYENQSSARRIVQLLERAVEMGNGAAAFNLAKLHQKGTMVPRDINKARTYLETAIERKYTGAILRKALELGAGNANHYEYEKDREAAFLLLKQYIELSTPLDMSNNNDREALYFYYYLGACSGHDMDKEAVAESWKLLLEVEGSYTQKAKSLQTTILQGQGRYEEAVQLLLDQGTETAMEKVEDLFFHEYFTSRPQLQQDLENHLLQMRDSEETISEVREELYEWYAWRYETGKDMVKDPAIAFAYYGKAAALGGWEKYQNYRKRILNKLEGREKIVFFKNVMMQGYLDVAKDIADLYEQNYQFEEAKEFYLQGSECVTDRAVKQQCREGYTRCKERLDKRQAQIEEAMPSYNQCNTSLIGQKKDGFIRLGELSKRGNTYAALCYAQIAEQDVYLKDTLNPFPADAEIFSCYKKAAEAGEREAISRMAEILEYGQLGQRRDLSAAERWKRML